MVLKTRVIESVRPCEDSPREVAREFARLLEAGARLRPAGNSRRAPRTLLARGYAPRHAVSLFDTTYFLTDLREDDNFRYFVGYVLTAASSGSAPSRRQLYPRIFYKDSSLVWRVATHYIRSDHENWIGKGDLKWTVEDGHEIAYGAEETTNLPLEVQDVFDVISRRAARVVRDHSAVGLVLRKAPHHRMEPYRDFSAPRWKAMSDARNRVNRGASVAKFERAGDPSSLRFVAGFEPDFEEGVLDVRASASRMYGGRIEKYRILSVNRQIQYGFIAAPRLVWIVPPQTLTKELSTYGVRTVDVEFDDELCVPGYEYHFVDESYDPPQHYSQIPPGFAGAQSEVDPSRADAAPWLEKLAVIRRFREVVRPGS